MKRAPAKRKTPTKTKLKAKADQLFRDKVRARGYCQAAGLWEHHCGGVLETAHVEGRANHRLRWEFYNALCLCSGAHRYWTSHPVAWWLFVEEFYPRQAELIREHRNEIWDKRIEDVIDRLQAVGAR